MENLNPPIQAAAPMFIGPYELKSYEAHGALGRVYKGVNRDNGATVRFKF